ncbi:copper resistance protein NlpE N-terminal domain-containing protein [uncultured Rikenella sp.]|uniref:copper resistance protein NlpE N-terminal domain-containing protein n=1 Tax=uncultured Rikenella sp. TaxID=368003 RepID=UPI002613E989|nr:copper resistance protein NlpE N-terminal domain-containing protein [uncultured Rikenella sp.]
MKKVLFGSVCAAVVAFGMVACGDGQGMKRGDGSDTVSRRYVGTLPAADGPGIVYDLTLFNLAEDSLSGEFALSMTYLEAQNGKNATFDSEGEWVAVQGIAGDRSAVYYQLIESGVRPDTTNFLYLGDSVVLLGNGLQRAPSNLNYTLILED